MGQTKQANKEEFGKSKQEFKFPLDPMKTIVKRDKKITHCWSCYDGDDKIEIYKDKTETAWLATYDINTGECDFYISKFSGTKPNFKKYSIRIPSIELEITNFVGVNVDW